MGTILLTGFFWMVLLIFVAYSIVSLKKSKGAYTYTVACYAGAAFLLMLNDVYFDWQYWSLVGIATTLKIAGLIMGGNEGCKAMTIIDNTENQSKRAHDIAKWEHEDLDRRENYSNLQQQYDMEARARRDEGRRQRDNPDE